MIPTHSCVGTVLYRNASTEPRRFARTIPCLKKLFDIIKLQELMVRQNFGNKTHDISKKTAVEDIDKAPDKDKKEEQEEESNLKQQTTLEKKRGKNCRTTWTERSTEGYTLWKPIDKWKTSMACGG